MIQNRVGFSGMTEHTDLGAILGKCKIMTILLLLLLTVDLWGWWALSVELDGWMYKLLRLRSLLSFCSELRTGLLVRG